jgi:methylmalonyl-CoA/ethylmalonyl-CoA epimerase
VNKYGLRFHHFGLAVRDSKFASKFLFGLGYHIGNSVYDPLQRVNLILATADNSPDVELISPSNEPGPLDKLLSNRNELLYHVCYISDNVESSINLLNTDLIRTITVTRPKPAILFEGRLVSFYYVHGFGLIEILEDQYHSRGAI